MSGYVFENKGSVRYVRNKTDQENFKKIKAKFGLKRDIDLVSLCASVGFFKLQKKKLEVYKLSRPQKLVDMTSFSDRYIFDALVIAYLEKETGRLDCFETLFYSGFKIMLQWYSHKGPETTSELESFVNLWNYLSS